MTTNDRLPDRTPGLSLRVTGELPLDSDGWFGTGRSAEPSRHAAPGERPNFTLLQRALTGLQCRLHAEQGESESSRRRQ